MADTSIITCLAWIRKGFAKSSPVEEEMTEKELKSIKEQATKNISSEPMDEQMQDLEMDKYDEENELPVFANEVEMLKDENKVKTKDIHDQYPAGFDSSEDEKEDYKIKPTDSLIVAGIAEQDFSNLAVYIYDEENSSLYVHHDTFLSSAPLCLEWLPYIPGSMTDQTHCNCAIVGTMGNSNIEIWDLDVLNSIEPKYTLKDEHTDSIMSLSLNPLRNNILSSGGADMLVVIWDLNKQAQLKKIKSHKGKVQCVKWNPKEDGVMISAGFDKQVILHNVQQPKPLKLSIKNEVESLCWEPNEGKQFAVSDEEGIIEIYDARYMSEANKLATIKAHSKAATNISYSISKPKQLISCSIDGTVKQWDVSGEPKLVCEKKGDIGEIFGISICPDIEDVIVAGGSNGELMIWETD